MTPDEILSQLSYENGLPVEALKAASEQRGAMVPLFLGEIEKYLAPDLEERLKQDTRALFFAFHLLGEWREKSAYRPLARLLHDGEKEADFLLGDATTSTSHRVMAAVFDGDPQPLFDIVLDQQADQFIRSRMCETLVILVREGLLEKDIAAGFLRDSFDKLQPRTNDFVWNGWMSAIAMLGLEDLKPLVKQAFDEGCNEMEFGPLWADFKDFEKEMSFSEEHPYRRRYARDGEYALWGNTIDELSHWAGFSEFTEEDADGSGHDGQDDEDDLDGWDEDDFPDADPRTGTFINVRRNVGRNDPCPCGSGLKFKKCCGR